MREAAVFKVIDVAGKVYGTQLTSGQASAMMEVLLSARPGVAIRSERIDSPAPMPAPIVAAVPPKIIEPLEEVEVGYERDTLHTAIVERATAKTRLAAANQAVELAKAYLSTCQSDLEALVEGHLGDITASGASLAESFKAGGAAAGTGRSIDRSVLLDAEVKRDTANAALDQLVAEQVVALADDKAAETRVRLLVMVVQRAEVDSATGVLEDLKAEFWRLHAKIDASRFAGLPLTIRSTQALRMDLIPPLEEPIAGWRRFSAALMENANAQFGDQI